MARRHDHLPRARLVRREGHRSGRGHHRSAPHLRRKGQPGAVACHLQGAGAPRRCAWRPRCDAALFLHRDARRPRGDRQEPGSATVHFADGQDRAETTADGTATIDKKEATLDRAIHDRIVRPRKSGEADAAIDPLADPAVLAAVNKATFEVLVGFQLSDAQLGYNVTR
jgi:hypothetical protein